MDCDTTLRNSFKNDKTNNNNNNKGKNYNLHIMCVCEICAASIYYKLRQKNIDSEITTSRFCISQTTTQHNITQKSKHCMRISAKKAAFTTKTERRLHTTWLL